MGQGERSIPQVMEEEAIIHLWRTVLIKNYSAEGKKWQEVVYMHNSYVRVYAFRMVEICDLSKMKHQKVQHKN